MTQEEKQRVIEIYGEDYEERDIPTYIRERDNETADEDLPGWEEFRN